MPISLTNRKKKLVVDTLADISNDRTTFEAGDEMMDWIDGQFEDPATPLSKLFSLSGLDHIKPENWKWLLWVMADVHYFDGRGHKSVWPDAKERYLLDKAAELREKRFLEDGKRLSLGDICNELVKRKEFRRKTGRYPGSKLTPGALTTQLKLTIKKYKLILTMPTIAADMLNNVAETAAILASLGRKSGRPAKAAPVFGRRKLPV
jgi:hypothetical protein